MVKQKLKCYNCVYRTKGFKVGKLTHYHCVSPVYEEMNKKGDPPSPWETLVVFSDSCKQHKLR